MKTIKRATHIQHFFIRGAVAELITSIGPGALLETDVIFYMESHTLHKRLYIYELSEYLREIIEERPIVYNYIDIVTFKDEDGEYYHTYIKIF